MAWIESHQTLGSHRKLIRLANTLNISKPQAVGHLHYLWWWSLDNAKDGDLGDLTVGEVADVAMWNGNAKDFADALRDSGFITEDSQLHDWHEYAGRLVDYREAKRQRDRERMRARRERLASDSPATKSDSPVYSTVPNPTQPNSTEPKEEEGSKLPDPLPPEVVFWNSFSILPSVRQVTKNRLKSLKARRADPYFTEHYQEAIKLISETPFCLGKNQREWKADFDFLLRPDTVVKVMEGKYGTPTSVETDFWGNPVPKNGEEVKF